MTEYLRGLLSHRDAARVAAGRPPLGPNRLRGAEILREHLSAGHASTAKAASTAALKLPKRRRIMRSDGVIRAAIHESCEYTNWFEALTNSASQYRRTCRLRLLCHL